MIWIIQIIEIRDIVAKKDLNHELGDLIFPILESFPTTGGDTFVEI